MTFDEPSEQPLGGVWEALAAAFDRMEVSVQVGEV